MEKSIGEDKFMPRKLGERPTAHHKRSTAHECQAAAQTCGRLPKTEEKSNGRPLMDCGRPLLEAAWKEAGQVYEKMKLASATASGRPISLYGRPLTFPASTLSQISTLTQKSMLWNSLTRPTEEDMRSTAPGEHLTNGRPQQATGRPLKKTLPTLSQNLEGSKMLRFCLLRTLSGTDDRRSQPVDRTGVSADDRSTATDERPTAGKYQPTDRSTAPSHRSTACCCVT